MEESDVPDEVLRVVLALLPARAVCAAAAVCRRWRVCADDDAVWAAVTARDFGCTAEEWESACAEVRRAEQLSETAGKRVYRQLSELPFGFDHVREAVARQSDLFSFGSDTGVLLRINSSGYVRLYGRSALRRGVHYVEIGCGVLLHINTMLGVELADVEVARQHPGEGTAHSYCFGTGEVWTNGRFDAYGPQLSPNNNVLGCLLDMNRGIVRFAVDGKLCGHDVALERDRAYRFMLGMYDDGDTVLLTPAPRHRNAVLAQYWAETDSAV